MPAWPGTLPAKPLEGSYSDQRVPNVVEFGTDVGPTLRRRRQTATGNDLTGTMHLTQAQKTTLDSFFKTDCADGALAFTMTDWELGTTATFTWNAVPAFSRIPQGIYYIVSLSLRRKP